MWQEISTFVTKQTTRNPFSDQVLCAHKDKKWMRFGRYDLTLKRWYYSGTNERSQWSMIEGDEPTHWQPLPEFPK